MNKVYSSTAASPLCKVQAYVDTLLLKAPVTHVLHFSYRVICWAVIDGQMERPSPVVWVC